ncbi:MAG: acyl-CoA thioesterase [Verrucomicrobiales bacterium]|nr:acyl-CoA thioesterase [Verrucomicrobiales bacterium]
MSEYSQFETLIPVRPDDIDMNQHVHNSRYYDYVLAARYEQMERCYKMSMEAFLERGFSWFVRSAYIEHKRPLHLGDVAVVRTRIEELRSRGVKVWFEIHKQSDDKLVAKGWFDYAMVSVETGRPQTIPEDIVERYSI